MHEAHSIPYSIRVSNRAKGISLKVDHRGLTVVTPRPLSEAHVQRVLAAQRVWLSKRMGLIRSAAVGTEPITAGQSLEFLGQRFTIELGSKAARLDGFTIFLPDDSPAKHLKKLLRAQAKHYLETRTRELAAMHAFRLNRISVRDQHTRWGSCSNNGNISLSWRLALAPLYASDYVILHELAHTREMNHSSAFWAVVADIMPNYRAARKWLKENGHKLHFLA